MKITYLANMRFPTEMAHGIQIAKSCEAFAAAGHQVELVVPRRYTPITESPEHYYDLKTPFTVTQLAVPDTVRKWGRFGFIVQIISFAFAVSQHIRQTAVDVLYGRDEHVLAILILLGVRNIVWESHDGAWNASARLVAHHARSMIVVTSAQRDTYIARGVPASKLLATPNGIDTHEATETKHESRERLGIPLDAYVALYAGAFGGWKGTDTLFAASERLPAHIQIVVIGGRSDQVTAAQARFPRVLFLGERPYRELTENLASADVCILPNTGTDPVSVRFTSPLKLLAYMAAGKPIVASDLPSVRELVGENAALLVRPDDPEALARGIETLAADRTYAEQLGKEARTRSEQFNWASRAARILNHLDQPVSVLAIYRGKLTENRGTPIRVRSFLERLATDPTITLTVASWDDALPFAAPHLHLTNNKFDDVRTLLLAVGKRPRTIVLGHTMATWYYLAFLKFFTGARIALEMHGFLEVEARFYGSIGSIRYTIERFIYGLFYPFCDLITTCSENAAEILVRYNKNVLSIYGGVDATLFKPNVAKGNYLTLDRDVITIGYAGNSRAWQGLPFLIDAFTALRKTHPKFRLALLVSETKGIPKGEGITVVEGVSHEEVPTFLAECDVLVIPRMDNEVNRIAFPSKLIEYLAMGKPVVASATSDCHRVITNGADGLIYVPGDTQGLIDALIKLTDKTFRERLGNAAVTTVARGYTWEHQTALLTKALKNIVQ